MDCRICHKTVDNYFNEVMQPYPHPLCNMCNGTTLWGDEWERWLQKFGYTLQYSKRTVPIVEDIRPIPLHIKKEMKKRIGFSGKGLLT